MKRYDQDSSVAEQFEGAMRVQGNAPSIHTTPNKDFPLLIAIKVTEDRYAICGMTLEGARELAAGLIEAAEWVEKHQ